MAPAVSPRAPLKKTAAASLVAARRHELPNGLVVILRPNRSTRSVAMRLMIRAGGAFDPPGAAGTAHLAARLLDRGAGGLSGARLAEDFDALGIAFDARARLDSLDLTVRALSRHLAFSLERLHLLASAPDFPEEEVAGERGRILTELAEREQDTAAQADDLLCAGVFPAGHPYREPITGTRATVEPMTRAQLASFFAARGGPRGSVLGIAGDFDERDALDQVRRVFGAWTSRAGDKAPLPRATPLERASIVTRPIAGKTQGDVAWGFTPQIERLGPDLQAVMVMNSVLGDFGMGGRIGRSVREEAGLAYHASSYIWAGLTAGPMVVRAGVAPEGLRKAIALMRSTLKEYLRRGPTPRELDDSKQALAAAIPRRFETNLGAAALLADSEYQGLGFDFADRAPALIARVDKGAAIEAARRYVTPDRSVLVVTGPEVTEKELR
jgi:zinc protease